MDVVKKAQQRARRLTKGFTAKYKRLAAGSGAIFNDAVERFNRGMQLIRESSAPTSEKRKAREAVAQAFLDSGESTKTEIQAKYKRQEKYMSQRAREAVGESPERMAKWIDSTKNQKSSMLASFYLASDQILLIRDRMQDEGFEDEKEFTAEFYRRLDDAVIERFMNREMPEDELSYYLQTAQY